MDNEEFLRQMGDRVRGLRATRGMTRKMLAQESSVSERYLSNLELGKGNISIILLRQVAKALQTDLVDLLPTTAKHSPELKLIDDFVSQLPVENQVAALHLLYEKFSSLPSSVSDNRMRIALVGLRGAGKSTLGRLLEKRYGILFVPLVNEIEKLAGMAVSEILSLSGQDRYRRLEEKALLKTLDEQDTCCIETGGGIVAEPKVVNLLLTTCFVIWVKTSPEEHMQRVLDQGDFRPMADNDDAMQDLRRILEERIPYYKKAHAVLDTSGKSVEESYGELVSIVTRNFSLFAVPNANLNTRR